MKIKQNKLSIGAVACLSLMLWLASCQPKEKHDGYIVQGNVTGVESGWVKLYKQNMANRGAKMNVIDSIELVDGKFEFRGKVEKPDQIGIKIGENHYSYFFLENSEITLDIVATIGERGYGEVDMTVKGSELNKTYDAQKAIEEKLYNQEKYAILDELREEGMKAYRSKDEKLMQAYKEKSTNYQDLSTERFEERKDSKIEYVKANPSSVVAPYILSFMFSEGRMSKDEMEEIYPLFQGDAKKTAMYAYYTKTYDEIFRKLAVGAKAPDFTLPSLDGGTLTLSEVKGKYVFVDFWASWCVPCRASFKHLKEVYAKYHKDGFEVVAIGAADVGVKWKKAIEEDQTVWNHVFDGDPNAEGSGKGAYGKVSKMYAVPFLPTTFLLDENGIILGRQLRGEALDAKMKELYGY